MCPGHECEKMMVMNVNIVLFDLINVLLFSDQDTDVIWTRRIPDDLRRYPAVACLDWTRNGAWPNVFNIGVLMAKAGSEYLKHFLRTFG